MIVNLNYRPNIFKDKEIPSWKSSSAKPEVQLSQINSRTNLTVSFSEYEKDSELEEFFKNKRIALVGPSSHLQGSGDGELIDSYDIVCRVNKKTPDVNADDYGSRFDVLMGSFNFNDITECRRNKEFIEQYQYLIGAHVFMWDYYRAMEAMKFFDVPFHKVYDGYLLYLYKIIGTVPNTGTNSISILLNYDIEELYITGINFYNMGKYGKVYEDGHYKSCAQSGIINTAVGAELTAESLKSSLHNQDRQIDYFHKLVKTDERITLDGYLREHFGC